MSESRREVYVVRMLDFSRAVGSTRSRLNILRVELDSHADTCVVGRNALVIHEHPNVVMVSGFDPLVAASTGQSCRCCHPVYMP